MNALSSLKTLFHAVLVSLVTISTVLLSSWAEMPVAVEANFDALRAMKSFEVEQFHQIFDPEKERLPAEISAIFYAALQSENGLPKASPADGILTLRCSDARSCRRVYVQVRQKKTNGPVVWSTELKQYWLYLGDEFFSEKYTADEMVKAAVDQLAHDYNGTHTSYGENPDAPAVNPVE